VGVSRAARSSATRFSGPDEGRVPRLPDSPEATELDGVRAYPHSPRFPSRSVASSPSFARAHGGRRQGRGGARHQAGVDAAGLRVGGGHPVLPEQGMTVVHGQCILMYPKPATSWFHGAHRWVWELIGRAPADRPPGGSESSLTPLSGAQQRDHPVQQVRREHAAGFKHGAAGRQRVGDLRERQWNPVIKSGVPSAVTAVRSIRLSRSVMPRRRRRPGRCREQQMGCADPSGSRNSIVAGLVAVLPDRLARWGS